MALFTSFLCLISVVASQLAISRSETYIVHMDSTLLPTPFSSHHHYYTSLLTSVSNYKHSEPIYSYNNAIHGFCANLSPNELDAIKKAPGFLSSTRDVPLKLLTTHSSDFLGLNSLSGAWPVSDYGKDVIIGVVDTGIWPESKSFSDDGMTEIPMGWNGGCYGGTNFNSSLCNRKLIGARFFNKGLRAAIPNITLVDSARDLNGHGTHVSSTAAGNYVQGASYFGYGIGTSKGTAPRARLAMYTLGYTQEDGFYSSDVIAAIDSAIKDGIDILSLSITSSGLLYEDPVSIATFAATQNGVFISKAAGNRGPSLNSIDNGAPWVLTVGAGTIDREFEGTVILGNGASIMGSSLYTLNQMPSPNLPIIYTNACGIQEPQKVIGKIVLCQANKYEEGDAFSVAENFKGSGVAGAVIVVNALDLPTDEIGFPAIFVNGGNGKLIQNYVGGSLDPTASLVFGETLYGRKSAPKVADYSSRGPSPITPSILKPDLIAPGDAIIGSWQEQRPVNLLIQGNRINSFAVASGTSMATPHAAGVAALLKGAHPDWSPAAIRSAMMTTADFLDNSRNPIKERGSNRAATPLAMGAGHVNPNKALFPGLIYDADTQDYVNFLCALNPTSEQIRMITRSNYNCSNPSIDLNYPTFIAYFNCINGTKSVQFQRTLTNVGKRISSYSAKLEKVEGFEFMVVPPTLVFRDKKEKLSYMLKIQGPCLRNGAVLHGSVTWVENEGQRAVRSTIVIVNA
ncbi:hypothetical protein BUALT_Bualt08G0047200 [Buddleja alternifolia]|uniref:Subtilisin-like protease n=1 Tax=Buddleja alternifolia TaxID=168488 RepID=A0AAV6XEN7_9LAMI|nr:hypothetical protein BUALT_Bualt08G0047200 [Buddleja alternifolia]